MSRGIFGRLPAWGLGLALLGSLLLASCGGGGGGGELKSATLMLDWTPNTNHAGIYVALEQGWYEEAGIDLQIVEPAAAGVEAILAEGQAQFGISYAEYLIPARLAGVNITSIAAMLPHNESSLMSLTSDGISRPADLEGKTYGGFGGALEQQLISTLVACDGGDPSMVEFVEVGNIDYVPGMEQDRFDFVWVFESWDVLRARALDDVDVSTLRFIDYTDCIPDWYTPVIATSDSLIESDPELVSAFLKATARGYDYAMEHPTKAAALLLQAVPELDQELVQASAAYLGPRYAGAGEPWGVQEVAIWERFEAFLRWTGLTDTGLDTSEAFTNEFLPQS